MCVLLVGGMDRLEEYYMACAKELGIKLKVYTKRVAKFSSKIGDIYGVIIFTNKVSHA